MLLKDIKPGDKFGLLTLIELQGTDKRNKRLALFKCDCGNEVIRLTGNVLHGKTSSCGCYKKKYLSEAKPGFKHGYGTHPLYDVHHLMMRRCYEAVNKNYHQYGGRGIMVCDEWHDVSTFIAWAENNGWIEGLQLDRENTNGNYEPTNCRFVSSQVNNNNRRDNYLITCNGVTKTLQQWADKTGIYRETIASRIRRLGWCPEAAVGLTKQRFKFTKK